jgi:hypothetical protein
MTLLDAGPRLLDVGHATQDGASPGPDLARLVVESDPRRRAVLRQQVDAWATALLGAD